MEQLVNILTGHWIENDISEIECNFVKFKLKYCESLRIQNKSKDFNNKT